MRPIFLSILTFFLTSAVGSAWAAGPMKPGLWEMTIQSDMMKAMPKISPQQLKQMRDMGIQMPDFSDKGMVNKVCITKEMTERDEPSMAEAREMGCEPKNYRRSGNQYSMDLVCDNADMKGTGKMRGTFASNEKFNSSFEFKGNARGQPVNQSHEASGKWLGADCGTVKPVDEMVSRKK